MIHHIETQVLILLAVAVFVGIGAHRVRLPYTLALVVAGFVLSFVHLDALASLDLSADLLLLILLPALLFEAAFHIEWTDLRRELWPVLALAVPGVAFGVAITGGLLYAALGLSGLVPGFGASHAFLFAAVITATDPISVLALFRELGVARRLYLLVEGESLLNDGVAVVAFFIVLAIFGIQFGEHAAPDLATTQEILSYTVVTFVRMAVGGALVGLLIGGAVSALTRQLDDHLLEMTLTTLVAYGSFLVAETLHTSGVLSTVCAGLVMGSVGAKYGMSPVTKRAVEDFWEYMAFLANSFIFLLVGLEMEPWRLVGLLGAILVAFIIVVLVRAGAVYSLVPLANRFAHDGIPTGWRHVMVWGGLRGSLSMVLILALPREFPGKETLVDLVFGVVGLSLFVQGLSVKTLLGKLGLLRGARGEDREYAQARARILAARGALVEADRLKGQGILGPAPHRRLKELYTAWLDNAEAAATAHAGTSDFDEQLVEGLRRLAESERYALRKSVHAGILSDEIAGEVEATILQRLHELEHQQGKGASAVAEYVKGLVKDASAATVEVGVDSPGTRAPDDYTSG